MAAPRGAGGHADDRATALDTRRHRYRRDGAPSGAAISDRWLRVLELSS